MQFFVATQNNKSLLLVVTFFLFFFFFHSRLKKKRKALFIECIIYSQKYSRFFTSQTYLEASYYRFLHWSKNPIDTFPFPLTVNAQEVCRTIQVQKRYVFRHAAWKTHVGCAIAFNVIRVCNTVSAGRWAVAIKIKRILCCVINNT